MQELCATSGIQRAFSVMVVTITKLTLRCGSLPLTWINTAPTYPESIPMGHSWIYGSAPLSKDWFWHTRTGPTHWDHWPRTRYQSRVLMKIPEKQRPVCSVLMVISERKSSQSSDGLSAHPLADRVLNALPLSLLYSSTQLVIIPLPPFQMGKPRHRGSKPPAAVIPAVSWSPPPCKVHRGICWSQIP